MRISIARDFSDTPAGRTRKDGRYSGVRFREEVLRPLLETAIEKDETVCIDLDGVVGLSSAFLEESFGGLVRHEDFTPEELQKRLRFTHAEPWMEMYIKEIWMYI